MGLCLFILVQLVDWHTPAIGIASINKKDKPTINIKKICYNQVTRFRFQQFVHY